MPHSVRHEHPKSQQQMSHQTFTHFESALPPLPSFSPLILSSLHTPDLTQWHHEYLEYSATGCNPASNSQLKGDPFSDPDTRENVERISNRKHTDLTDGVPTSDPLTTELSTPENPSGVQLTTSSQNNASKAASICSELNHAVIHLPPIHDVGAFHAHALVVEVSAAPGMQRGFSHRAEIVCTTAHASPSPKPIIDLEFLSFSPLFSSHHDKELLSPSWQLELTHSSSWHLAAESVISLSQPIAQGSSLMRRPATRRKGADSNTLNGSIRKSPYLNGSRTLIDLSEKRPSTDGGILRAINSPSLKSHGYRVRFEEPMETQ